MPKVPNVNCRICDDPLSISHVEEKMLTTGEFNDLFMSRGWVCLTGEHESTLGKTRYVCRNCTRAIIKHAPSYLKPKPIRIEEDFSSNALGLAFLHFRQGCSGQEWEHDHEVEIIAKKSDDDALIRVYGYSSVFDAWKKFMEELNGPREIEVVANVPAPNEDASGKEPCPDCGGTDFRTDAASGEVDCVSCGKTVAMFHPAQSPEDLERFQCSEESGEHDFVMVTDEEDEHDGLRCRYCGEPPNE